MAMRFCILGSGSAGNCAFLQTENARILVDAGFSARRLRELLHDIGEKLESIDAIFLTHEHGDHAGGIDSLKKFPQLRLFANAATARAVQTRLEHRPDWQIFETGARFRFRDLEVESFNVPHDAADPVGFLFHSGHEDDLFSPRRTLAWLTDLGHAPQHIHERIRAADVIAIESNHCADMLKADLKRPWPVKQRIGGRHGHLSNQSTRELLEAVASPRWQRVFLTHLSRECNSSAAVELSVATLRARLTCQFSVVASGGGTPFYEFT
jgi:phosphoribosyl 1,2-cyclic phosphodiesterase